MRLRLSSGNGRPACDRERGRRHHAGGGAASAAKLCWCSEDCARELGQQDKGRDGDADHAGRLQIERVHLGAQPLREVGVLNLLQAAAVDVPNAALPDVSQTLLRGAQVAVRKEERRCDGETRERRRFGSQQPDGEGRRADGERAASHSAPLALGRVNVGEVDCGLLAQSRTFRGVWHCRRIHLPLQHAEEYLPV